MEKKATDSISQPLPPPPPSPAVSDPVKKALVRILNFAQAGACDSMAPLLVFNDGQAADSWHRGLRYDVEAEKLAAEKECAKLQVIVTGLQEYVFYEFATEEEQEGEWLIWKVRFKYPEGESEEKAFAFLKAGDGYLLGDID